MTTGNSISTAKHPWMAVFLSQLLPGVGQIYAGNTLKGLVFLFLFILSILIGFSGLAIFLYSENAATSRLSAVVGISLMLVAVMLSIYSLFDAHKTATNYNAKYQVQIEAGVKKPWLAVFLSYVFPGVGQFYNRQITKGIALIIALLILHAIEDAFYPFFILLFPLYFYSLLDAYESAEKINGSNQKFLRREGKLIKVFVIVIVVFDVLPVSEFGKAHIIQAFKIPAGSMLPTLEIGDHILINKIAKTKASIKRGDLIVFKYPEDPKRDFIKRVIAVGGETIESRNKSIFINGTAVEELYVQHTDLKIRPRGADPRDSFGPYTVPENGFFVMGDNRDQSYDSRYWGYVPKETVKGKAFKIYWSWNAKAGAVRWDRIGTLIR